MLAQYILHVYVVRAALLSCLDRYHQVDLIAYAVLTVALVSTEDSVNGVFVLSLVHCRVIFGSIGPAQESADGRNRRCCGTVAEAFLD